MATRLSVNINDDTAAALRELAAKDSTTVTEIVRRAVSVYKFFDEAKDNNQSIQFVAPDEKVTELRMLV